MKKNVQKTIKLMRLSVIPLLAFSITVSGQAQQQPADTVIVPLAESSKIIFTIQDREDLEVLKYYNFQKLFEDIFEKLETVGGLQQDSSANAAEIPGKPTPAEDRKAGQDEDDEEAHSEADDSEDDADDEQWVWSRRGKVGQTFQSYNIDLGTNNYLQNDDQFPDGSEPYSVRPWGSWYLAANSVQRTKLGRNFFVEWGLGVSWYNFKFQEHNTRIEKDELGVRFVADSRGVEFIKSKLSATFINASLVPVLDFGQHSHKPRIWDGRGDGFRFGFGPYVGYRIASKAKLVYKEEGDREIEKDRDNFYLNNLRYGFRMQIGVRSTDLFIHYDMNELFASEKGPRLNAVSFGLVF